MVTGTCPAPQLVQCKHPTHIAPLSTPSSISSHGRGQRPQILRTLLPLGCSEGSISVFPVLPSSTKCAVVYWTLDSMLTVSSPTISSLVINRRNPEIRFMKRPHVDAMRCLLPDLTLEHSRKVSRTEHPPGRGLANV